MRPREHRRGALLWFAPLVVALVWLGSVAAGMAIVATVIALRATARRLPAIRQHLAAHRYLAARKRRHDRRAAGLEDAGVPDDSRHQLKELAESSYAMAAEIIDRFEVDAILDRYAELLVEHRRCKAALAPIDLARLGAEVDSTTDGRRKVCVEMQVGLCGCAAAQIAAAERELVAIATFLRTVALRCAIPPVSDGGDVVERAVAELECEHGALLELANERPALVAAS